MSMDQPMTPLDVRNAIIECFYQAHCADASFKPTQTQEAKLYCQELVSDAFAKSGGNFANPTKQDLVKAIDQLAEFSKNFRKPEIIKQNYQKILDLISQIP